MDHFKGAGHYTLENSLWSETAYIKAVNSDPSDEFGGKVALDGGKLEVGSQYEDSNATVITNGEKASHDDSSQNSGAVYVYKFD